MVTKGHIYYLNKPAALSMYYLFLPPDIKWLTGLHKCLKFAVHTCIGFKELRCMHVLRHFVFERVSLSTNFHFFPWERPFFAILRIYLWYQSDIFEKMFLTDALYT